MMDSLMVNGWLMIVGSRLRKSCSCGVFCLLWNIVHIQTRVLLHAGAYEVTHILLHPLKQKPKWVEILSDP